MSETAPARPPDAVAPAPQTVAAPPQMTAAGLPASLASPPAESTPVRSDDRPRAAGPSSLTTAACYVDFENLLFSAVQHGHSLSVSRIVRHLNRLGREATGIGWSATAVYAHWDAVVTHQRHAQDDWAMMGWRTVAVPTKEDHLSKRPVKNLVDFVMSLDMLEDARDRGWEQFVIVSGDSDFCEVVERLKRLRRRVTVVSLKPNLGFRLQQAADDVFVWGFDDVTGDEPLPVQSYRRLSLADASSGPPSVEDPYQVLLRAVRVAERDQGTTPVAWRVIRDEYFLRMTQMAPAEADKFVRALDEAGYVTVVRRRGRDGATQVFLSVPR